MIKASVAMGVCVAMRPTSIMLWMMLALLHLQVSAEDVEQQQQQQQQQRNPCPLPPPDPTRVLFIRCRDEVAESYTAHRGCRCGKALKL